MIEGLKNLYTWFSENMLGAIQNSHDIFWNGNQILFICYIVCLTYLLCSKGKQIKAKRLLASFSIITMLAFCYNPFVYALFMKMPQSGDPVFSRIWIFLPVWLVISVSGADMISRANQSVVRYAACILLAATIVFTGTSMDLIGYYDDSEDIYKVRSEGIAIADSIIEQNGQNNGLLLFVDATEKADNFVYGGTVCYAIEQYTGEIEPIPIYINEQEWNDYYLSDTIPEDGTDTADYINDCLATYRSKYDFSYVVMPQDDSLHDKMVYSGYQYVTSVSGYDIYDAMPRWWIQSFSDLTENNNKIYLLSDNMGHFILIGGGSKADRKQLQRILSICGKHIDAWILPSPSASYLEGLNYILTTDGFEIDNIYMPAINSSELPEGFMTDQDMSAYEGFLELAEEGKFNLISVSEGERIELYGMELEVFSDMLDVQSGSVIENSMLFRFVAGSKSILFCSYVGFDQGQAALDKYGDGLDSDYVQIASGSGIGLGLDFYNAVDPEIAFCDSITDDAGRQTYDLLIAAGISCYCIENEDPSVVMIE